MLTIPPDDLLPVLVADLAEDEARDVLDAAAFTGGRVWVPLEAAPVSAAQHILEVHTPGIAEPALYIATPLGPPTENGFPLKIEHLPDAQPTTRKDTNVEVLRGRRSQSSMNLSESHTKDLSHVGPLPTEEPEAAANAKIGQALANGKLVIEQLIGRGGVGAVYKARHRELMMPVAVKVLHESFQSDIDFCRRFYAEALAASRLDHPNITRVIDFGQEADGELYFAMEFLDGVELRAVLDKERRLHGHRIASVMMQVCAGLLHAHTRGIVHRDIKPENLVLVPSHDDDGKPIEIVKVCDFGIALQRALPSTDSDAGVVAGTPEYMSPEQCRSDDLDARSDVYAVGVVLYELATGQLPFVADKPMQLLNKHQFTPPLAPSKINPQIDPLLERIIMKAMAKDPAHRQQSMRDLRSELRELLDPIMIEASPPPPSMREVPTSEEFRPMGTPRKPLPTLPEDEVATSPIIQTTGPHHPHRGDDQQQSGTHAKAAAVHPEWLERGYDAGSSTQQVAPASQQAPAVPFNDAATRLNAEVESLQQNVVTWCARLAQTVDPKVFAKAVMKLDIMVRELAQRGDMQALWTISSTVHGIASEGHRAPGSRAGLAANLLKVFEDPAILVLVAEQLLNGPPEARDKARRLIIHAGVAGAYGLYGARVKLSRVPTARPTFVAVLSEFGTKAWPVVRASLEKISAIPEPNVATLQLAEDLLLCVSVVGDESAGHLVLKYLRVTQAGVCRAATAAIIKLWRERAKPVLVGMLGSKDDVVRVAGMAGLKQLNAIDEHIVPRLDAILSRRVSAGEEVRAAAATALAHASETARQPAVSLLAQLLTPQRDAMAAGVGFSPLGNGSVGDTGTLSKQDAVVIAMARSLLTIGGRPYRGLVAERAERSPEPLRAQLRGLLAAQ